MDQLFLLRDSVGTESATCGGTGAPADGGAWFAASVSADARPPTDRPAPTPALKDWAATRAPPATAPPAAPAPALAPADEPPPAARVAPPPDDPVGAGAGGGPAPPAVPPPFDPPSRTLLGSAPGRRLIGIGSGRLSADLASCSADIAWYMSKPMKLIAL